MFTVTQNVSKQIVLDTLVSAVEGGSGYWAANLVPHERTEGDFYEDCLKHGFDVTDREEDVTHSVMPNDIKSGIQLMSEKYNRHFANMITENGDAETGDVLLQCVVLRDIIYG